MEQQEQRPASIVCPMCHQNLRAESNDGYRQRYTCACTARSVSRIMRHQSSGGQRIVVQGKPKEAA